MLPSGDQARATPLSEVRDAPIHAHHRGARAARATARRPSDDQSTPRPRALEEDAAAQVGDGDVREIGAERRIYEETRIGRPHTGV